MNYVPYGSGVQLRPDSRTCSPRPLASPWNPPVLHIGSDQAHIYRSGVHRTFQSVYLTCLSVLYPNSNDPYHSILLSSISRFLSWHWFMTIHMSILHRWCYIDNDTVVLQTMTDRHWSTYVAIFRLQCWINATPRSLAFRFLLEPVLHHSILIVCWSGLVLSQLCPLLHLEALWDLGFMRLLLIWSSNLT